MPSTECLVVREDGANAGAKAHAIALTLAVAREAQAVAIEQELALFAVLQRERLGAAPRDLQQRSIAVGRLRTNGWGETSKGYTREIKEDGNIQGQR
jgi:hypothetical protein